MENFDRLQGSTDPARSNEDRPNGAASLNGVRRMFNFLTTRPALAATTSIAALVIGVAVILPVADIRFGQTPVPLPETEGDIAKDAVVSPDVIADAPLPVPEPRLEAKRTAEDPAAEGLASSVSEAATVDGNAVAGATAPEMSMALADDDLRLRAENSGDTLGYIVAEPAMPVIVEEDGILQLPESTEAYANAPVNPVKVTAEEPVSTFSIDVDTASYAVIRSSLGFGILPTPDQVRVEEMINYFPYDYPAPDASEAAFKSTISVMQTPWNPGTRLVTIGLQGALPPITDRPPLNLVFLIDTSGSMEDANKLGLLKQSLSMMLAELRPEDQIAIVTYAGSAGEVLPPTKASDKTAILAALDNLSAGGSTAGAEGLELAYRVAEGMAKDGTVSRILLATDGDFNVGVSDPEGLEAYVAKKRESGTYLSVLGFGRGNLDDAVMQSLAQNGNGTAAYIDTLSEARKVLVDQLTGALFPIADDVKIQIEWNPTQVAEYRLIGYETRALRREDFNNDAVDAGEIGAGTQVTAIYEVTAPGSDALLNDPLRYGGTTAADGPDELGILKVRAKAPGADTSDLTETRITGQEPATDDARFAAAIAGFGQILQNSVYLNDWGWDEAIALGLSARGDDPFGYRIEAVNLMRLAQSLSAQ
ncbi:von Willebrand factor type A domain-containing protein [Tabrizicola sp.]|uniref:vWA domain-containing protein n=1 Tax=Tabrizicola sp. TaxID=2005166 RepID=UPI00386315DB